jgi:hypothetical protein
MVIERQRLRFAFRDFRRRQDKNKFTETH